MVTLPFLDNDVVAPATGTDNEPQRLGLLGDVPTGGEYAGGGGTPERREDPLGDLRGGDVRAGAGDMEADLGTNVELLGEGMPTELTPDTLVRVGVVCTMVFPSLWTGAATAVVGGIVVVVVAVVTGILGEILRVIRTLRAASWALSSSLNSKRLFSK